MVVATAAGCLSDQGGIGGLIGLDSDSELESSLGGPGGLKTTDMNFLGALEIPSSEKGSSWRFGCSVSALVGGFLQPFAVPKVQHQNFHFGVHIHRITVSHSIYARSARFLARTCQQIRRRSRF